MQTLYNGCVQGKALYNSLLQHIDKKHKGNTLYMPQQPQCYRQTAALAGKGARLEHNTCSGCYYSRRTLLLCCCWLLP
jgi:hypothetical protein